MMHCHILVLLNNLVYEFIHSALNGEINNGIINNYQVLQSPCLVFLLINTLNIYQKIKKEIHYVINKKIWIFLFQIKNSDETSQGMKASWVIITFCQVR